MYRASFSLRKWSWWLLAAGALIPFACGPDSRPRGPCGNEADYVVTISALDGPLPPGTTVTVTYGSGQEVFVVGAPASPEIMFCDAVDRDGMPLEGGASPGEGGASARGEGGGGGEGPATKPSAAEGLRCALWTQGPATIEIVAEGYPELREELRRGEDCTLTRDLLLAPEEDGGA